MAEQLAEASAAVRYCHLCDCLLGWLHNATEHVGVAYVAHEPFLEDDCEACWQALANGQAM